MEGSQETRIPGGWLVGGGDARAEGLGGWGRGVKGRGNGGG